MTSLSATGATLLFAADDIAWPGLVAQISRLVGRDIENVPASTWLRMG